VRFSRNQAPYANQKWGRLGARLDMSWELNFLQQVEKSDYAELGDWPSEQMAKTTQNSCTESAKLMYNLQSKRAKLCVNLSIKG
jgi:hypothetical protein